MVRVRSTRKVPIRHFYLFVLIFLLEEEAEEVCGSVLGGVVSIGD